MPAQTPAVSRMPVLIHPPRDCNIWPWTTSGAATLFSSPLQGVTTCRAGRFVRRRRCVLIGCPPRLHATRRDLLDPPRGHTMKRPLLSPGCRHPHRPSKGSQRVHGWPADARGPLIVLRGVAACGVPRTGRSWRAFLIAPARDYNRRIAHRRGPYAAVLIAPTRGYNMLESRTSNPLVHRSSSLLRGVTTRWAAAVPRRIRRSSSLFRGVTTPSGPHRAACTSGSSTPLRGVATSAGRVGRTPCSASSSPLRGATTRSAGWWVATAGCPHRPSEGLQHDRRGQRHRYGTTPASILRRVTTRPGGSPTTAPSRSSSPLRRVTTGCRRRHGTRPRWSSWPPPRGHN